MSDKPRDWDRELAEIDKVIARAPGDPPVPQRAPGSAPAAVPAPPVRLPGGRDRVGAWLRTLLVVALAAGLPFWPYAQRCGLGLAGYAAAVGVLILAGIWALAGSWRHRQGVAHFLSLLALLWGLALAAAVVLPRIGYAREVLPWSC